MEVNFLFPAWGIPLGLTAAFFTAFIVWAVYLGDTRNYLLGAMKLAFGWPIPLILSLIAWVVYGVLT